MSCSYKDKLIFVVYNLDTSEILHHENELLYGVVQTGERWNMSCVQMDAHNMVHKSKTMVWNLRCKGSLFRENKAVYKVCSITWYLTLK